MKMTIWTMCGLFVLSAPVRGVAPTNPAELDSRISELRQQYASYLRSLPQQFPARERTALPTEWKFIYEAKESPKVEGIPPAPAWQSVGFDDSKWEVTTVPEWRYRTREGDDTARNPEKVDQWKNSETTADTICWYRTTFRAARPAAGKRLWLCFDGVEWEAQVWLNGELLGTHRVYYEPFRFDVSDKVKGTNTLAVRVIAGRSYGEPMTYWGLFPDIRAAKQRYVPDRARSIPGNLPIGYHAGCGFGIHRNVYLEQTGPVRVSAIFARNDLSDGNARVKVELDRTDARPVDLQVELLPENCDGRSYAKAVRCESNVETLAIPMPDARIWSPETPNLYRCRVTVKGSDANDVLFGCRSFTIVHRKEEPARAPTYRFEPVKARWLRIFGRGSDASEWNSIWEVNCPAILGDSAGVTTSKLNQEYPAAYALDGDPNTRWATQGRGNWIQFKLDANVEFDRVRIGWFEAETRQWDFDLLVSEDGQQWTKLAYEKAVSANAKSGQLPNGMLLLNGKPVYLRGSNIQGFNAYSYWGQTNELLHALLLLKAGNFNAVRSCQHVEFPEVLEMMDRVGMMSEQDQGGGYRGSIDMGIRREQHIHTGTVLARQTYNHPGVVLLTFGNEHEFPAEPIVRAALAVDPQRIFKPISGRFSHSGKPWDLPEELRANAIDDGHPYSGWYGKTAPQTWSFGQTWSPRRLVTLGEFGAEALDAYETMRDHYPPQFKPPAPDTDTLWAASQVQKHDLKQIVGLGRDPKNLAEYIEASQNYQEAVLADKTIGMRLSPQAIAGYFHFHFIDVVPVFWPKSIVSHDHRPKKAYYQLAQINQPLVALPQLSGRRPDAVKLWIANDLEEAFPQTTLSWTVRHDGKILLEGRQIIDVPALGAVAGETVDLLPVVTKHPAFDLELTLADAQGRPLSRYQRTVRAVPAELLETSRSAATADPFNPTTEDISRLLARVNDWQIAHPTMKSNDRNWERGTWFTGVMAAGQATGDEHFLKQALDWGLQHQWQVGTERSGGNKLTCAQTWLELYFLKTNRAFIEPTTHWLNSGQSNTPSGAKVWYLEGGVRYADSLYVGAPPLAMLAKATGDAKYLNWMNAFFWDVHAEIFDPAEGLFYRDKRFIGKTSANGKKVFWSRGNGWAFASLPRILTYLPPNDESRAKYEALFKQMAGAIAKQQQPDGLWRPNLGDPEEFPMPETSGTGFFCYGLAWGVRNGLLDRDTYLPVVKKAWAGLVSYVSVEGKVQWGQQVGDRPTAVQRENSHEYVTGTFLLAGSEMFRLVKAGVSSQAESKVGTSSEPALLPPAALAAGPLNASAYLHADKINIFFERQGKARDFQPTGLTRGDYLRVLEGQARAMHQYQDGDGRIIDPVEQNAMYYATPCYAHAVAALAASGYTENQLLLESGMKALDASLRDMAENKAPGNHGDFFTWPAMFAYELFQKSAAPERKATWAAHLQAVEPKKLYRAYLGRAGNWTIVNTAGEFLRHRAGFTSLGYVEDSLAGQRPNFTPLGQYDEGGNPLPYDHFPRHYLAGVLHLGYRGAQFEAYREWLWRGAWTSLFMQSPFGELPTGYRSSHHIWNESEQCVTFELLARAYAQAGRPAEAGAFKRAAHLSLGSIKEWIRPDGSGYIVKNRYPIEARHGYESYSAHTCYNMLACSMLAQAWQFADESVKEKPAPADVGGFVVPILKPFRKIFANAGGTYVEYDTSGDHVYNPTGLIRVHVKGGHPQLGPSDGCAPRYSGTNANIAVGPAWQDAGGVWHSLAEMSPQQPLVEVLEEQTARASFRVSYILAWTNGTPGKIKLAETIVVEPAGVTVTDDFTGDIANMRVTWPMLVFDGSDQTEVQLAANAASLRLNGRGVRFTVVEPSNVALKRSAKLMPHRNGMAEVASAEFAGRRAVYRLTAN